jgi:hypothetical protein
MHLYINSRAIIAFIEISDVRIGRENISFGNFCVFESFLKVALTWAIQNKINIIFFILFSDF